MWAKNKQSFTKVRTGLLLCFAVLATVQVASLSMSNVSAQTLNVTARVTGPPPSTPAIITDPLNGTHLSVVPLVVLGTCASDLIVRIFDNDLLAGSAACTSAGQFTINITLEEGSNILKARNYDAFDQAGPDSPSIQVFVTLPKEEQLTNITETSNINRQPTAAQSQENQVPIFAGTPLAPLIKFNPGEFTLKPEVQLVLRFIINLAFIAIVVALLLLVLLTLM